MTLLAQLCDLDQLISLELEKDEISAEDLQRLVDNREQLLQSLLQQVAQNPQLKSEEEWRLMITRTKRLLERMQEETNKTGLQLQKFRRGQRSLQQYKKFT
ncbi:flagellar rod protein FlaI [Vibrio navarrensis]|uniref:Flagellar rod protein FlaI n=1 Tax=Vibrio navarrensis TaxID=29495 RepID=A0A099MAQ4_9VIBR|nr:flagellar rod protein FlaI [Vibrio navarrensis]EHA1124616.1 flagellar protein FliT [Vibrio navarrensis]EJL6397187.1 flagellar protein FliT [Vibrio navarrensis]EJL6564524.1 flagellar protein FliT [Vibrio navarrensis]KGK08941.1 flagellar rod protein FlaI [Vibrio navarrensis]KGK17618.1 flagellar rod protein FlaI [Vibrio navarrensis]